ncbi:helix-turn-helix domain-containing protein [Streptomyces violaceusniger]|uniref:helix-turn-helix domain-containing protein n=1 Tax=Streptomyces violaceusniger TaxID=68280 RepID=UPI000995E878|nr:helix-turn-helix transcriptional regulator [Streptomyces hygroscopicus]AQW50459.1 helix-turn-helix domain-containing protein [Streptomyces hygroscopicus]
MSSHASNRARVIPLRPATADPAPQAGATAGAAGAPAAGPALPAAPAVPGAPVGREQPGREPVKEPLLRDLVGGVLRRERLAQQRTLKDVAEAARISMPYLSELERGRKEASSEVLAAAARALGISLADLLAMAQGELIRLVSGPRRRRDGAVVSVASLTSVTSATSATSATSVASPASVTDRGSRNAGRQGEVRLAA